MTDTCTIPLTEAEKQQLFLHNLKHRGPIVSDTASKETRLTVFRKILAARPSIKTRDGLILGAEVGGLLTHKQAVEIRQKPNSYRQVILTG